ncbi:MAG TPA: zinc-dependent metalloprotease [Acidimicrobiia bacterium]|nr:zinc-dependent metalloprotease [Acidimicrobiia bacterium]
MTGSIHWPLASRIAQSTAGSDPFEDSYHFSRFAADADDLVGRAAPAVAAEMGMEWVSDPTVRVVTRRQWAEANIDGFSRLLAPAEELLAKPGGLGIGRALASRLLAAEVGALVGILGRRVLGQYELVLPAGDEGDTILFVGANVLLMERQNEFRPSEFRYWVALHECTHRLQFTGVPWLRGYFLGLVESLIEASKPQPGRSRRLASDMRAAAREGRPMFGEAGLMGLFATPDQRLVLEQVQALMSLLEGHGHVVMDRIGARELVTQHTMSRVLKQRRKDPRMAAFFRITGLELKMKQYEMGERFILDVERRAGFQALDAVWTEPDALPTLAEISEPQRWLERVG